jgi:hypothetical protein
MGAVGDHVNIHVDGSTGGHLSEWHGLEDGLALGFSRLEFLLGEVTDTAGSHDAIVVEDGVGEGGGGEAGEGQELEHLSLFFLGEMMLASTGNEWWEKEYLQGVISVAGWNQTQDPADPAEQRRGKPRREC